MDAVSDSDALLRASTAGDRDALEALLRRHLPSLRTFVRLRLSPALRARLSASDVVQSACIDALRGLEGYDDRGEEAFRGWLFTLVLNKIRSAERHHRAGRRDVRRERSPNHDAADEGIRAADFATVLSPSEQVMATERLDAFEAAFDALPEQYREVIALSRIARLSRAEVATRTGRTEASVRNLLSRGLAELARSLRRRE